MDDRYRMIFRGEVLEGQHPAVVRKRLGQEFAFTEAQLEALFSGRAVVVKRDLDKAAAARYQASFRKVGARLLAAPEVGPEAGGTAAAPPAQAGAPQAGAPPALDLLPLGSDLLRADERTPTAALELDLSAFEVSEPGVFVSLPVPEADAPDVSHLSLAEPGARLTEPEIVAAPAVHVPSFEIAAAGTDLAPRRADPAPPLDLSALTFEVADTGARLGPAARDPVPAAPDTSHLDIVDDR